LPIPCQWQQFCFDDGAWVVRTSAQPLASGPLQMPPTSSTRNESYVQRKMREQEERSAARRQFATAAATVSSYVCDFLYFCCIKLIARCRTHVDTRSVLCRTLIARYRTNSIRCRTLISRCRTNSIRCSTLIARFRTHSML